MVIRIICFTILMFSCFGYGQINHPKASPLAVVEQHVGLTKITVRYSRPAVKGRHIFGTRQDGMPGLVPNGRIWRVGANESTKITVDKDVNVMGHNLPEGTYALYAFPNEKTLEIAFHTNTGHWGDGRDNYNPKEDLFRIRVLPQHLMEHQENFLITFDSINHNSAKMSLLWANTRVQIPFEVDTAAQMEQEIAHQINTNPSALTYYEAARYLQEQDKEMGRALDYLNKALELGGDTYYFHRVKSLVEARMGDYRSAIASAKKSMAIADSLGKDEFVRMNEKNIIAWKKLLE